LSNSAPVIFAIKFFNAVLAAAAAADILTVNCHDAKIGVRRAEEINICVTFIMIAGVSRM